MLQDFIAGLPIDVISKTEIEDNRVFLPTKVDSAAFYKDFSAQINSTSLTTEKCIYIASQHTPPKYKTSSEILIERTNQR